MKDGVEYFPFDTDFFQDDKVRLIKSEFGAKGIVILLALLCDIYRGNGYFKVWDKDSCLLMADAVGCGIVPENIKQVVFGCLRRSFFDEGVFQMFGILTSAGIQRRYIRAISNREEIRMIREYWLLDENNKKDVPAKALSKLVFEKGNRENNPDKTENNLIDCAIYPKRESKEKEKEKENKGKNPAGCDGNSSLHLFTVWESINARPITRFEAERIDDLVKISGAAWVEEAMKIAGDAGIRKISYVEGILNRWHTEGKEQKKKADTKDKSAKSNMQKADFTSLLAKSFAKAGDLADD